ncbi:2-keto-4-pentenoate hydratase [Siccirubricoccus phaeus]|uniref:2-keto-4-pentenoate hydratase n=1 Tax=Siccirubricoccus phaeus TaxID=2595053 RepID=UPI0011F29A74|nr:fumarylacetoacetate hydrolase family protein [Siccirubricoccus phaeus]
MAEDRITQAAQALLAARQGAPKAANLGAAAPTSMAEAFAIQRAVLAGIGGSIGGYKCAAPPGKDPSAAIMNGATIRPSPATWQMPREGRIGIETEVAFRLARPLPARATPYNREEVLDAVAAAFPVMEMVESRYQDPRAVNPLEAMADNVAHAGLVFGADVPNWRSLDLPNLAVKQTAGGETQVERIGGNPSLDPVTPLVWLANFLPTVGLHLEAGQVVTTGSCTGLLWVPGKQRVTGGFAGFGEVAVDLA